MQFEYSPYLLPLIAAALVSIGVAVYAWTRRGTRGALTLSLLSLAIAVWTSGYALEIAAVGLAAKYFWGIIQYFGIAFVPYGWFIFSILYSDPAKTLSRRFFILTGLIPSITVLLALTTQWHGLIWQEFHINRQGDFSALGVSHGLWFWVHFAYSYLLLLIGAILVGRALLLRKQGLYHGQVIALLVAVLTPWIANAHYLTGYSPIPFLDLTPFAFTVTAAALAWAIFGFRLVDVSPIARDLVVEGMRDGMIVLDSKNRIVDINAAAGRMIGIPVSHALGMAVEEALRPWQHLFERFQDVLEATTEVIVGEGNAQRRYEVRLSPLYDLQNHLVGRVIMARALDEASVPLPRFATEVAAPLPRAQPEVRAERSPIVPEEGSVQPERESPVRAAMLEWMVKFFAVPVKTDLEVPPGENPVWHQTRERVFTIIARTAAVLGSVTLLYTMPFIKDLTSASASFSAILVLLWFLGLARGVRIKIRTFLFLSLIYALGLVEIYNFGYSVEAFTFFMAFVVTVALLTRRRDVFIALTISLATMGGFGWQIGRGSFIPAGVNPLALAPSTIPAAINSLLVFTASASVLASSVTILLANLNRAWQMETQATNLLQQEHDLLEQRVNERTRDLAEAESKYRTLVEQLPAVLYVDEIDESCTNSYISPQVEALLGYSLAEWKQDPNLWLKLLHPDDRERALATIDETISKGNSSAEYRLLARNRVVWVHDEATLVRDESGWPLFVQGILEDITERKRAEEQIRKLSQAIEQSGSTVVITDTGGKIEYANPKFTETTGYTLEEAIGKNPRILKSGEQSPEFYQELWKTISAGQVWRGALHNKRKDGRLYWESAVIAPVQDQNGEITNYVAVKEEVTREKEMEEALRESHQIQSVVNSLLNLSLEDLNLDDMLARALESILAIPWLPTQPKGGIFLVGDQPGVLVMHTQRNLGAPLLTLCARVPFGHCLCGRAATSGRIEFADCVDERHDNHYGGIQPHGHYNIPILLRGEVLGVLVLYLDEGRPCDPRETAFLEAVASTLADMIRDKQAEEALALARDEALDASRFKSQILSRVSHELRTPLSGVLGYAELLADNAFGALTGKQKEAITHVIDSTHYLTQMVSDLLDEAEISARTFTLENAYFSPAELLDRASAAVSVLANQKGLSYLTEISTELPGEIYGDLKRLQQVIINLAGNAVKFTNAGEVRVRLTRPAPAQWAIVVSDTGAGIPKGAQEYIFEPFRQVDNRITRENRGSGLGLSITRQLVELMGGQITLESDIGKGSEFTVALPILNAPGE